MPRARSPNREKAFEIWKASKYKKKNKEIAAELGVSETMISRWKNEDEWEKKAGKKSTKRKSKVSAKKSTKQNKEESVKNTLMKAVEENEELTEKQKLFCLFYLDNHNATQAYLKAYQCAYMTAKTEGHKNLAKPCVKKEIKKLKEIRNKTLYLDKEDIVEKYMKIAFSDMTDFVQFGANKVLVYSSDMVDGGIISEVKQTKEGISIKLKDSMKALAWLSEYFEMNPMSKHKKWYDKKLLQLKEKQIDEGWE